MFSLQQCQIGSLTMLSAYFDFKELYDLLQSEDAYLFSEFAESCLKASCARIKLFGTNDVHGSPNKKTGALRCIKDPELCLELELSENRPVFQRCRNTEYVKVCNILELVNFVYLNSQVIYGEVHQSENPNDPSNWQELKNAVKDVIYDITENGERQFNYEAAAEFYIYLLLHMQAAVLPNKPESLDALKRDMDRLCPISASQLRDKKVIELFEKGEEDSQIIIPMQYYTGEQLNTDPLSLVELKNPYDKEITVKVSGTVLFRKIPPRGSVYAIRKGPYFVSFIPRFRLNGEMVLLMQNGYLCNVWEGKTEYTSESKPERRPVSWAQSGEYGTFIIDQDGKLDESASWPDFVPDKDIVYVDAFALDYCMLLSDGTVESRLQKKGWENLISVSLGLNSAISINERREPVLGDGTIIRDMQASAVRIYNGHYICLNAQGQILTDSGLQPEDIVCGIAICERGYVLAFKKHICLIDFHNNYINKWKIPDISELEADKTKIAYYDAYSENVKFLSF